MLVIIVVGSRSFNARSLMYKKLDGRDISSIVLVHDDDKEEEFYVAYDEDEFRYFNKLQSTGIDDEGNLIIKIGRF